MRCHSFVYAITFLPDFVFLLALFCSFLKLPSSLRTGISTLSWILVNPLPSSFRDTYNLCHLLDVRPDASSLVFLFSGLFVEHWSEILFSILFFISACLNDFCFRYSQVFVSFFYSVRSDFSWLDNSIPSVYGLLLILSMADFSMPNPILISSLYILTARIRFSNSFHF